MDGVDEFNKMIDQLDRSDPVQVQAMIDLINSSLNDQSVDPDFQAVLISQRTHLWLDLWDIKDNSIFLESAKNQIGITLETQSLSRLDILAIEKIFDIILDLSLDSQDINTLESAIFWGMKYFSLAGEDFPDYAINLFKLAVAFSFQYKLRSDERDLEKSIALYEEVLHRIPEDSTVRLLLLNTLAVALGDRYAFRGKEQDLDRSIALCEEVLHRTPEDSTDRTFSLNTLAIVLRDRYARRGKEQDLDNCIALFEEALRKTPEEANDRSKLLNNLAVALGDRYALRGKEQDLDKSIALLEEALSKTPEDANDRSKWLNNLAFVLRDHYALRGKEQDLDKSIALLEEALSKTPEEANDRSKLLNNLAATLGDRYALRGKEQDLDKSIALLEEALSKTPEDANDRSKWLNNLAFVLRDRYALRGKEQDLDKSIEHFEEALEGLPESQIDKPKIHQNLANLHFGIGDYQAALKAYEGMTASLEVQRSNLRSKRGREKMISDYSEAYARLVFCCLKLDQPEKALRYAEAAKSRALVDSLHNQVTDLSNFATDDEVLQVDLDELQKVQQEINWLLSQLGASDETAAWIDPDITRFRRPPEEISAELSQKREKEETLWQILERKAPVFAMTVSAPPFNLQDAVNLAKQENAALISYYKHSGGWVAFVVVSDNLYIKKIEGVEELLNHYQSAFSNLHSEFARLLLIYVLEQAWSVLIQPLMPWLPDKDSNLVIAPFAGLHHLPFAAFTNPNDGSYLVDHYHLKAATSLGTLKAMHTQAEILPELKVPSRAITAVGYAGALAAPAYLKAVDNEVAAISGLFSSEPPLTGQNAIIQNVLSQAPGSQTLHLACHGIFNPEQPQLSGLMLEDGWLTVRDVMTRMNLSGTEMVVMSACLSGLSKISKGEELTGLLTAFISSRAKAVVGSLWSVDDQSTEKLMVRFYELINQGMQKHDALRQAQLDIRQQSQWSHPYYWAPFFLTGVG